MAILAVFLRLIQIQESLDQSPFSPSILGTCGSLMFWLQPWCSLLEQDENADGNC